MAIPGEEKQTAPPSPEEHIADGCATCLFADWEALDCRIVDRTLPDGAAGTAPDWCPLRVKSILVRLRESP